MMTNTVENSTDYSPYKGAPWYDTYDSDLFFGRSLETRQIISRIMSTRLSVLHAISGAGKTSILKAKITPEIEKQRWLVVYARPNVNPVTAVCEAVINSVLPSPALEAKAIRLTLDGHQWGGCDTTINEVINYYNEIPLNDKRRRDWISGPANLPLDASTPLGSGRQSRPFYCRLLQGTVREKEFWKHFKVMSKLTKNTEIKDLFGVVKTSGILNDLLKLIEHPKIQSYYDTLIEKMTQSVKEEKLTQSETELVAFFKILWDDWGRHFKHFRLVLVLDQFEEIFTLYHDQPRHSLNKYSPKGPSWEKRLSFFAELQKLYLATEAPNVDEPDSAMKLPFALRFIISMRSDYLTHLDGLRRYIEIDDRSFCALRYLPKKMAEEVIEEPAKIFNFSYQPECFKFIIKDLLQEGEYIQPARLQIVCDSLWDEGVSERVSNNDPDGDKVNDSPDDVKHSDKNKISYDVTFDMFDRDLHGTSGLFTKYIKKNLRYFERDKDPASYADALDMLGNLITPQKTRNIVLLSELIIKPLGNQDRLRSILAVLEKGRIIRMEAKLGEVFVEIMHEFMIEPIGTLTNDRLVMDQGERAFRAAFRDLVILRDQNYRNDSAKCLSREAFQTLNAAHERLGWDAPWAVEIMLRNALIHGAEANDYKRWAEMVEEIVPVQKTTMLHEAFPYRFHRNQLFQPFELIRLQRSNEELFNSLKTKSGEIEYVPSWEAFVMFTFKSAMKNPRVDADKHIRKWIKEAQKL